MDLEDERAVRAASLQRSSLAAQGIVGAAGRTGAPLQHGGAAFAEEILARSGSLRPSNTEEWTEVQKAAFSDWVNSTLRERDMGVNEDLLTGIRHGTSQLAFNELAASGLQHV